MIELPPHLAQERQKAVEWARTMLESPAVIVDFETTGVSKPEVVQIGVVDMQGNVLMDTLIKPSVTIPADVIAVHGITNEMVEEAPSFHEMYIKFSVLLAGKAAIAYNVSFEKQVLQAVCERRDLPLPRPRQWHCAMINYASFYGQWNAKRHSFTWQGLGKACTQQNITVENAHNAVGDCRMTLSLIQAMARSD
ncbi:MAG: exonuclease domain-containing protein [Anaerolineae bacterium]